MPFTLYFWLAKRVPTTWNKHPQPPTRYPRQSMATPDSAALAAQDEFFMRRALQLAAKTAALASPNPQVGCVIVRDDANVEVIGEGAHLYDNYDHAEIIALKQAAAKGL